MIKVLSDQNFHGPTLRSLIRRVQVDLVRVEDAGIKSFSDPKILEWAANEKRVIITHDAKTFSNFAYERMSRGLDFFGVVVVPADLPIGLALDDLALLFEYKKPEDFVNRFFRLPI